MIANVMKYVLVSRPRAPGCSASSRVSSGEIIALTVRNTYDIRYPAANAA